MPRGHHIDRERVRAGIEPAGSRESGTGDDSDKAVRGRGVAVDEREVGWKLGERHQKRGVTMGGSLQEKKLFETSADALNPPDRQVGEIHGMTSHFGEHNPELCVPPAAA